MAGEEKKELHSENSPSYEEGLSALEKHIFGLAEAMEDREKRAQVQDTEASTENIQKENISDNREVQTSVSENTQQEEGDIHLAETPERLLDQAIKAHQHQKYHEAEHLYQKLLVKAPFVHQAWANLGVLFRQRKATAAAIICFRRGLALNPKDGGTWSSLGNALRDAGQYEEAKRAHSHAMELEPGKAEIHYNLGLVHRDLGHLDSAEECFRRAELLGYNKPDLRWDHALLYMLQGDLERGFVGLEARWKLADCHPHFPDLPIWKGAPLVGQVLLVYAEHGVADSIQFCRYLPLLKGIAETIIFHCQPVLARLLDSSPQLEGIEILPIGQVLPEDIDAVIPLLSVPRVLHTTLDNIPVNVPYLSPPQRSVPAFSKKNVSHFRVGLVWHGEEGEKNTQTVSMPLTDMAQILDLPGIQFFSFQIGRMRKDIEKYSFTPLIKDLSPHMRDYADMARLIENMDLIISVDSPVAHIAGALNIPVWVMLPFAPDWRWQMVRGDSPWYPSMHLIRQTSVGDWGEVMHRVRDRMISVLHDA